MDRSQIRVRRLSDPTDDDYVPGTMTERMNMVWPLTVEVVSLSKRYNVESRLQRHVTRLSRREG